MLQKPYLSLLLVLLLVFSNVLSLTAVPTTSKAQQHSTGSLRSDVEDVSVKESAGTAGLGVGEEVFDVGEGEGFFIEGRMDMVSRDYPGTGANNHHDPITPGRA